MSSKRYNHEWTLKRFQEEGGETVKIERFSVTGMTCGNCVRHVEKALNDVPGVSSVTVDLDAAQATVEYDDSLATVDTLVSAVTDTGYTLGTLTPK